MAHAFKQRDKVSLDSFLQCTDGAGLESQISLEILRNFSDETLESIVSVVREWYTEVCELAIRSIFGSDEFHEERRYQDDNDGAS